MLPQIQRILYAIWWWIVRRWNGLKGWFGFTSLPELREFVYLDEDALISLLASTTGGITQQRTTTQREQISASIEGSLGPLGSSVGSKEERSTQAVRRYVIQSNFKEFYEMRVDDLSISDDPNNPPKICLAAADTDQIEEIAPQLDTSRYAELDRGNLFELDVSLESSEIYNYFKVFGAFEEMIESFSTNQEIRQQLRRQNVSSEEIAMVIDLMDTLMAGLIPIECTISNYGIVKDNRDILVEKNWAKKNDIQYKECKAVGFIDEENLWQDPTQVLFEENNFTIYGRIEDPVPSSEWNPLKLADVVGSVLPKIGNDLEGLQSSINNKESKSEYNSNQSFEDNLGNYIEWIAEQQDISLTDEIEQTIIDSLDYSTDTVPPSRQKELFIAAEEELSDEVGSNIEILADHRANYISQIWQSNQSGMNPEGGNQFEGSYIKVNLLSIYW